MSRDPYLVAVIFSYTDDGQIEGGSQNMSIELLFKTPWKLIQIQS